MTNTPIDNILETLAQMPKLHRGIQKNIFKKAIGELQEGISRHHLEILKLLYDEGMLHLAEIADLLFISKSQMTRLIDELIDLGMIVRQPNAQDRRKSNIILADEGKFVVEEFRAKVAESIKTWLSSLNDDELEELSDSLKRLQDIIFKLS